MTDSDISQLKALWQDVFGDTPEYINLVFHESHADDIFTVSRGGQILSMGFLQAYTLKYHDRLLPAGYFYGAATRPGERGKGHMARILQNVISEAERRHYAALILIPADGGLYDYYSRIGFKTAFYAGFQSYGAIPDFSVPARQKIVKIEDNLFFYSFFLEQELLRPVTLLHTLEQFRKIMISLRDEGGEAYALIDRTTGKIDEMIFCEAVSGPALVVKELFADTPANSTLLQWCMKQAGLESTVCKEPVVYQQEGVPCGMLYPLWWKEMPGEMAGFLNLMLD